MGGDSEGKDKSLHERLQLISTLPWGGQVLHPQKLSGLSRTHRGRPVRKLACGFQR